MEWSSLLHHGSAGRRSGDAVRNPFSRDHSRVIFSEPFRRLQAKTQVFPIPDDDLVHTRLTHSMEVASVGQTLGQRVGHWLASHDQITAEQADDIAWIVATACLAHDLGNPPFGHAGEEAIGHYFTHRGSTYLTGLTSQQQLDLQHFEGNAQGFRILTRLAMYQHDGGMRLTNAVLGAFTKYPQSSLHRKSSYLGGKKFGFFADDAEAFQVAAEHCGLISRDEQAWYRHPLQLGHGSS